jgi:hypothetical protein
MRHSCPLPLSILSGLGHFWQKSHWRILVFIARSGSPRWSRQPAARAACPSGRAGLLILAPWRFRGRQPTDSTALGMPQKSSPRQFAFLKASCCLLASDKSWLSWACCSRSASPDKLYNSLATSTAALRFFTRELYTTLGVPAQYWLHYAL